jgi:hypothetical protein
VLTAGPFSAYDATMLRIGCALACLALVACGDDEAPPSGYAAGYHSETYASLSSWLCHPGVAAPDNACAHDLTTTVVAPDGTATVETFEPAADPPIDCFYVYPTVSADDTEYSDRVPGEEEVLIAENQAARFGATCRVYAPIYRQLTVATILGEGPGGIGEGPAYPDVVDAFKHYVANENQGRGILLIGHSQGTFHLHRLIREEVEANPDLQQRIVAAYLLGGTVAVPVGGDVGGDFQSTPLCRDEEQVGCVVSYASYRATEPPEAATSIFGKSSAPGTEAACVHPAALMSGGPAELASYFPVSAGENLFAGFVTGTGAFADPTDNEALDTPFFALPGFVTGECTGDGTHHYLEISLAADPDDPRADDIDGDLVEGWGLHLFDANLALGDLVRLATRQAAAYGASRR